MDKQIKGIVLLMVAMFDLLLLILLVLCVQQTRASYNNIPKSTMVYQADSSGISVEEPDNADGEDKQIEKENQDDQSAEEAVFQSEPKHMEDYAGDYDTTKIKIIRDMIAGYNFRTSGDLIFSFGLDSSFAGFFDGSHRAVSNFSYELTVSDNKSYVSIWNDDKTMKVTYEIRSVQDTDMILYYEAADLTLQLKKY